MPTTVQPIDNLEQRMTEYRTEALQFYTLLLPGLFFLALVLSLAFFYAANRFAGPLFQGVPVFESAPWPWVALGFATVMTIPPLLILKPERPSYKDILRDIALRRALGMDDTVAK